MNIYLHKLLQTDSEPHASKSVCSQIEYLQWFTKLLKAHMKQVTEKNTSHSDIHIIPHKTASVIKTEL